MIFKYTPLIVAIWLSCLQQTYAKAVFAHYMVGTITQEHAQKDIDDAKAMGLDGFALNVGDATKTFLYDSLNYLFRRAEAVGFKLYISMDVYAAGDSCYNGGGSCHGPTDYKWIWDNYKGSSAYYRVNNRALISTFSSGGFTNDTWIAWKQSLANDMYFMPDFDETQGYYDGADGWWYYWGPVVDGVMSWESAWPKLNGGPGGNYPGDVSIDYPPLNAAKKRGKMYMMGLSALQYKNSYGANVYREGGPNLAKRMQNILSMNPAPDFVQVFTWNDGPESHYIGNLWYEQNHDEKPWTYANQQDWPHQGWQPLITSFINAYKSGSTTMLPASGNLQGAMWYQTISQDNYCPKESQGGFYARPGGIDSSSSYDLHWSVVVGGSAGKLTLNAYTDGGKLLGSYPLSQGLNYGTGGGNKNEGAQWMTITDGSNKVVYSASNGKCTSFSCPDGIYNLNYQVVPFVSGAPPSGATTGCIATRHNSTGQEKNPLLLIPLGMAIMAGQLAAGETLIGAIAQALSAAFKGGGSTKPFDKKAGNCLISISTWGAGNCDLTVTPASKSGNTTVTKHNPKENPWNVCYWNRTGKYSGIQYFNDPGLGRYKIEFLAVDSSADTGQVSVNAVKPHNTLCPAAGMCHPKFTFFRDGYDLDFYPWESAFVGDSTKGKSPGLCEVGSGVINQFHSGGAIMGYNCAVPCWNDANVPRNIAS